MFVCVCVIQISCDTILFVTLTILHIFIYVWFVILFGLNLDEFYKNVLSLIASLLNYFYG